MCEGSLKYDTRKSEVVWTASSNSSQQCKSQVEQSYRIDDFRDISL